MTRALLNYKQLEVKNHTRTTQYDMSPPKLQTTGGNGGHLGYRTALTDTILKGDHLRIISAKFG